MSYKYNLIETKADEKWDKLVNQSLNGTAFSKSAYLKASGANYKLYFCYKQKELRGALVLIEDETGTKVILDGLVIYSGIIYNKPTNRQNRSQQLSEQFQMQEFIASKLHCLYDSVQVTLHPSIVDIRPFLWVNYGTALPKYTSEIRYTSYVDIADFKNAQNLEDISIYIEASSSRRQQIRYAIKKNYKTISTDNVEQLTEFYRKTMYRQGIDITKEYLFRIQKLALNLIANNMAKLYASFDGDGQMSSMALFCWDSKRAYYLIGASDPDKRDGHSGTNVLWEAFYDLSNLGVKEVDLEGVNSPHRGWFKLSFGGDIKPYYKINYNKSIYQNSDK